MSAPAVAAGEDLGIINIADSAPQATVLGGYPVLDGLIAVVTLLGAVLVHRIRSVA